MTSNTDHCSFWIKYKNAGDTPSNTMPEGTSHTGLRFHRIYTQACRADGNSQQRGGHRNSGSGYGNPPPAQLPLPSVTMAKQSLASCISHNHTRPHPVNILGPAHVNMRTEPDPLASDSCSTCTNSQHHLSSSNGSNNHLKNLGHQAMFANSEGEPCCVEDQAAPAIHGRATVQAALLNWRVAREEH